MRARRRMERARNHRDNLIGVPLASKTVRQKMVVKKRRRGRHGHGQKPTPAGSRAKAPAHCTQCARHVLRNRGIRAHVSRKNARRRGVALIGPALSRIDHEEQTHTHRLQVMLREMPTMAREGGGRKEKRKRRRRRMRRRLPLRALQRYHC